MRIHNSTNKLINGKKDISYSKKINLLTDRMSNLEKDMLEIQNRNKESRILKMKKAKSKEIPINYTEKELYKKPNIETIKYRAKKNNNLNSQKFYDTLNSQNNLIYSRKDYLKNKSQTIKNFYEDLYDESSPLYHINQQSQQHLLTVNNEIFHHKKMKTINNNYQYFTETIQNDFDSQNSKKNYTSNKKDNIKNYVQDIIVPSDSSPNITNNTIKSTTGFSNELDYEFEIMHLKKRLKVLKQSNKNLNERLINVKKENEIKNLNKIELEKKMKQNEDIISNVINIYKNNNININTSFEESENNYKQMLLSLMELKYEYENNLLASDFFDGISNLLFKNKKNISSNIIYNEINSLIIKENKLQNQINEPKHSSKENEKYFKYCQRLCYDLNFTEIDLTKLSKNLNSIIISNKKENARIKQLKKVLNGNNKGLLTNFKSNLTKKEKKSKKNLSFDESETTLNNINNELVIKEKNNTIVRKDDNFKNHISTSRNKSKNSKFFNDEENEDISRYKIYNSNNTTLRKNKNPKLPNGKSKMSYFGNNMTLDNNNEVNNGKKEINKKYNDEFLYSKNANKFKINPKKTF